MARASERGALAQLHAHQEDEQGHQQPGEILHAAMAEGVVGVRLLTCQTKAHQGHHGGGGVGEVVEGVGGDGDGAGNEAGGEFARKEQQV